MTLGVTDSPISSPSSQMDIDNNYIPLSSTSSSSSSITSPTDTSTDTSTNSTFISNIQTGDIIDALDSVNKWYESTVRGVTPNKVFVHFNGWSATWDIWIEKNAVPSRLAPKGTHSHGPYIKPKTHTSYSYYGSSSEGRPVVSGAVGLRNLGNTCFMNSILSSMAHSPLLTTYFLNNTYKNEINRTNALGWQGRIAEEWGHLLMEFWCNKYNIVSPTQFKQAIGEYAPRFSGYAQQDSQELLGFLLDGLHEDLNRVMKKPATQAIESNGREDSIVASESWQNHLLRNQSIIVDLIQGQYKSTLVCPQPDCGKISITFDPYSTLSVPLPAINDQMLLLHFVPADPSKQIITYGTLVSKQARMSEVKEALSKLCGVPSKQLLLADVWNSKIYKILENDTSVSEIRTADITYAYEIPALENYKNENEYDAISIVLQRLEENPSYVEGNTYSRPHTVDNFGVPRILIVPRKGYNYTAKQLYNTIQSLCAGMVKPGTNPASAYKILKLDSDGRACFSCPNYKSCSGCELVPSQNNGDINMDGTHIAPAPAAEKPIEPISPPSCTAIQPISSDAPLMDEGKTEEKPISDNKDDSKMEDNVSPSPPVVSSTDDEPIFDLGRTYSSTYGHSAGPRVTFSLLWTIDPVDHCYNYMKTSNDISKLQRHTSADETNDTDKSHEMLTLGDCFRAFTKEEILSENEMWYCSKCKEHRQASKKFDLWTLPKLLIIHLKRFQYTRLWRDKISTVVDFPITGLDLSPYVANPAYANQPPIYDLYAVSNHYGGLGGGHYTSYVKNLSSGEWYEHDDSRVSRISEKDIRSSSAYVLFYVKRDANNNDVKYWHHEHPYPPLVSNINEEKADGNNSIDSDDDDEDDDNTSNNKFVISHSNSDSMLNNIHPIGISPSPQPIEHDNSTALELRTIHQLQKQINEQENGNNMQEDVNDVN